ncbi:MAG: ABC transporter ATP-binding protein [Actinobacteria bacterium]|nr:ABC transporter ATP-binding protein [Actinomycetota bacterium]MBO0833894.1 ABC transporter ATP-binding protein [Actinomycetota bacterium]
MPTPDASLDVRDLTGRAGSFTIGPLSLQVPAGRVLVILGPSGSGKTTLLTVIAGLRPSLTGRVRLAGQEVTSRPPERRRIGMVFQDGALFPHLTVRDNILFGPNALRLRDVASADDLLGQLGITHLADRAPRTLSGGERQRVALARALAIQPRLLLLDEPLSALDQPTREEMRGQLRLLLTRQSIPAIHVTHDRDEALTLADDLAIIADGTIRQVGNAREVADQPADPLAARLLGWTELGSGQLNRDHVRIGEVTLAAPESAAGPGTVRVYYRPEDVDLRSADDADYADSSAEGIRTRIRQIDLTVPLARIRLASTPAISALALHRDISLHKLEPGSDVIATLPAHSMRIFPAESSLG